MFSKYHIVYPCGDRSRLTVVEICNGMEYELRDYAVASRESFDDPKDACEYAQQLARSKEKIYEASYGMRQYSEDDYLD